MICLPRAEGLGRDAGFLQHAFEPPGLHRVVRMVRDVENKEGWNAFALGHVSDGGVIAVKLRGVAELDAMSLLGHREAMHAQPRLGGLNHRGHVVSIAIHGEAALERGERHALGLQVTVINADQCCELRTGGVAADDDAGRVAAVFGDVRMHPAEGLGDVAEEGDHVHLGQEAVARGDEDITLVHERLRLELDAGPVPLLPAASVNPEHHGQALRVWRSVDVHLHARVDRVAVWNVGGSGLELGQRRS